MNAQNFNDCDNIPFLKNCNACFVMGPTGPTGPAGPATTSITIGNVTTGDPGSEVVVTNRGTDTEAILDFVIPRGIIGPTGPIGATGPQGISGLQGIEGPTGPTGPAAGLNAYGGLFSTATQTFPQSQTPIVVTLENPMEDYDVTDENNTVTIVEGGVYEINYTISATLKDAGNLVVAVRNVERVIDGTTATIELPANITGTLAKSVIVDLIDGAALSLAILSSTAANGGTINQATLSVKLLD